MQQLYVNTSTQKISGTDCSFIVDPQDEYTCRRMVLNKFVMSNFMSNFGSGQQDFSYQVASGLKTLTISQIHLNITQFITYFNQAQANVVLTLTYSANPNIVVLTGSVAFAPRGVGWNKLGFTTLNSAISTVQTAQTYFNMAQTPVVFIKFNNLINQYSNGDGAASFMVPNLSSFGTILVYDAQQSDLNQQVIFPYSITFRELDIDLLDGNYKKIETNNGNSTGLNVFMSFGLYTD